MESMNFIRVASACPVTRVADIPVNIENIKKCIAEALDQQAKLVVFPELCVTAYTCSDLFLQKQLLDESERGIEALLTYSKGKDILIAVGAPLNTQTSVYNCAYLLFDGRVLGIVPKSYIPNYEEFYEQRWFTSGKDIRNRTINLPFQKRSHLALICALKAVRFNLDSRFAKICGALSLRAVFSAYKVLRLLATCLLQMKWSVSRIIASRLYRHKVQSAWHPMYMPEPVPANRPLMLYSAVSC
ncbi:NAD synthetase [Sporolactobacillus inulinus]|uniref:NAD synthetase n=1 Tax=Sporolactobacillus inulinus TaxID=2078 RepID=A0A4Y1Z9P4_9BACL|nr:nitrilase-related carbon-nitrogen hydrolase [Sporolactobacillus inulinus]GAY75777.1 NAD synthetase [Sporolactobacillus inulinus]